MSSKVKILVPCKEANHVCDKIQYEEASFWEKIKLSMHLIYCRACRKYSINNNRLSNTIKTSKVACLDKKCKDAMKKELDKAMKNQLK